MPEDVDRTDWFSYDGTAQGLGSCSVFKVKPHLQRETIPQAPRLAITAFVHSRSFQVMPPNEASPLLLSFRNPGLSPSCSSLVCPRLRTPPVGNLFSGVACMSMGNLTGQMSVGSLRSHQGQTNCEIDCVAGGNRQFSNRRESRGLAECEQIGGLHACCRHALLLGNPARR